MYSRDSLASRPSVGTANMSNYMIAPYVFQTKIRRSNPPVARTLANIDGKNTGLEEATGNVLAAMLNRTTEYQDKQDPNKHYVLTSVRATTGAGYLLKVEPGRKGIQSTIKKSSSVVARTVGDVEYVALRHLIFFPPNGHTALIFAERQGLYGAISFLRSALHQVLTEKFPALTFSIDAMTTLAALANASYSDLVFKAPGKRDASGRYLDSGSRVSIRVGFRGKRSVKDLMIDGEKIDAKKVYGILTQEGGEFGVSAPVDPKGWEASMKVETGNGFPRTFKIDDTGPALIYPINGAKINGKVVGTGSYPTDEQFLGACENIIKDIAGQFDITHGQKLPKDSEFLSWDGNQHTPWEVTYFDSP